MNAITSEDAQAFAASSATALDERAEFERVKSPENDSIQRHIKSARSKLATSSVARFMLAASVSVAYFNASERVNARRNIYAILKLADLASSVAFNSDHNAINRCVIASLFKCEKAEIAFTHKLALAATSDKIVVDAPMRKHLTRYTVSASTASTQASSTMSALIAANVVSEYKSEANETAYKLNDNALVSHLRAAFAA